MLKHPDMYPPGAGEAYRDSLKRNFLQAERVLLRRKSEIEDCEGRPPVTGVT